MVATMTHNLVLADLQTTNGIDSSRNSGQDGKEVVPQFIMDKYHLSLFKIQYLLIKFTYNVISFDLNHVPLIIDSGANWPTYVNISFFENPTHFHAPINILNKVKLPPLAFENTLCILPFKKDLLSMSQLTKMLN